MVCCKSRTRCASSSSAAQHAFFNGVGYETWENVWAIFNELTERDAAAVSRVASLLRFLGPLVQARRRAAPLVFPRPPAC